MTGHYAFYRVSYDGSLCVYTGCHVTGHCVSDGGSQCFHTSVMLWVTVGFLPDFVW